MTKEQTAYADLLNTLGSDVPDRPADWWLVLELRRQRREAVRSTGHAECPWDGCRKTVAYKGPMDGEDFAVLWEHIATVHNYSVNSASAAARVAWDLDAWGFESETYAEGRVAA